MEELADRRPRAFFRTAFVGFLSFVLDDDDDDDVCSCVNNIYIYTPQNV